MTLQDISTSYRQVQPVTFNTDTGEIIVNDIYNNRARAQQVTTSEPSATDMSTWKVGGQNNASNQYNWKVNFGKVSPVDPENHLHTNPQKREQAGNKNSNILSQTWDKVGEWWDETVQSQYNLYKGKAKDKALYWFNKIKQQGLNDYEALALVGCIVAESNMNPHAVMKRELNGTSGRPATYGRENCGEGLIQLTYWDQKQKYIKLLNNDPRRQGPKLPETKDEYKKEDSRHISDLNENDALLIMLYYYEDRIKDFNVDSFDGLISGYYLAKAGDLSKRYIQKNGLDPNIKRSQMERAYLTGKQYRDNANENLRTTPVDENNFVKSLRFTYDMGKELGYFT